MKVPIVSRFRPQVKDKDVQRAAELAKSILAEEPQLRSNIDHYRNFVVDDEIDDSPSLHLDDFSEIPVIRNADNSRILQQRSRLRAARGDWVAQSHVIEPGFSDYCENRLGLGRVHWLTPSENGSDTRHLALACWKDRHIRRELIQATRHRGLRYIHPHVSTLHIWELAALLSGATRMPISVIGPTPALSRWANSKIEFCRATSRLYDLGSKPGKECHYNLATLSRSVQSLAAKLDRLCIKFPFGTGGNGNFVIDSSKVRGQTLAQVRSFLKDLLSTDQWPKSERVLIEVWETNVISSPSVQTWIPPIGLGTPIIEGLFEQAVTNNIGMFVGSQPIKLDTELEQNIVDQSYLLAYMFQQMGYIGRCSFDLILIGDDISEPHIEFIECNARWGGTSSPMTLMNRLNTLDQDETYCVRRVDVDGLCETEFLTICDWLGDDLYDPSSGKGKYILFNPALIKQASAVQAIAIGAPSKACELLSETLPNSLNQLVQKCKSPNSISKNP